MIQRVNSLGRKKIPKSCVSIEVFDGNPRTFNVEIDLSSSIFSPDAYVVIEATTAGSSIVQRYECGDVGSLKPLVGSKLDQLTGRNVFFCLKIVDRRENIGRLLGIAENLRPTKAGDQTETGRKGILPVERAPLGQQLWTLEFREQDVFLLINEEVPHLSESVRSDPVFYSLIYPSVIRMILNRAIREGGDPDSDDDCWRTLWLGFARKLHKSHEHPPSSNEPPDLIDEWVDDVVDSFCEMHQLKQKYQRSDNEDA